MFNSQPVGANSASQALGDKWRSDLAQWGIPAEILANAPESPWIHPPVVFQVPKRIELTPSHKSAREVEPKSILDIGCGGGIAAYATDAPIVIGVDHQPEMLDMFFNEGVARDRAVTTYEGFWPQVANLVPEAEVVTAHHVVYNVAAIEEFVLAMHAHAKKRVVIELPQRHPQFAAAPLWKHFWGIERPSDPTPKDLLEIIKSLGIHAKLNLWIGQVRPETRAENLAREAHFARIRLCLPAEREAEVADFLSTAKVASERPLATIWWDV